MQIANSSVLWTCLSFCLCLDQLYLGAQKCQCNGASWGHGTRLTACCWHGTGLPSSFPDPAWVSQCCANAGGVISNSNQNVTSIVLLCWYCWMFSDSFLRPDALWLLPSFPTQLLCVFSPLSRCFMYLEVVNALYFPKPFLLLSVHYPALSLPEM